MNFISLHFFFFIVLVLIGMKLLKQEDTKLKFLLLANYIFYAIADIRFLLLLIVISLAAWYVGKNAYKNKVVFIFGIIVCLSGLMVFKYCNFFIDSFSRLFVMGSFEIISLILPVGISFYSFQAISYICDVRMGKMKPINSVWKVLLYVGFFPQITAGPIVKAHIFFELLEKRKELNKDRFSYGMQLFIIGLAKKMVIADRLGVAVDAVYSAPSQYSGISLMFAAFAYAIQIYCDFSGYSDMAIAVAYVLGFDYEKNFDLPYIAKNPSDFWRRWHISLSSWFRDYVYIPLGGNRKGKSRTYFNLFLTMLLSGFWHGASWNFILWGGIHGIISLIHKAYCDFKGKRADGKLLTFVCRLLMISFVMLLWIPFRMDNLEDTVMVIGRILHMTPGITYVSVFAVIYGIFVIGSQIIMGICGNGHICWKPLNMNKFVHQIILYVVILLIICFAYVGDSAFIYAGF